MKIALYDWPVSPFCGKVRAVLDHKQLAYELLPALSHRRELTKKGGVGKVPVLDVDGEIVVDSTRIVHWLEDRFPVHPVLPGDARARAMCHVLEDWCDESLYFFGLYYHWYEAAGRENVRRYFARTLLGRFAFRPYLARILSQLKGQGMSRKSPAHVRIDLDKNLDAVEVLLAKSDFLLGDGPWLCDFALMSQLVYLTRAPTMKDVLEARPRTRAFLERMKETKEHAARRAA